MVSLEEAIRFKVALERIPVKELAEILKKYRPDLKVEPGLFGVLKVNGYVITKPLVLLFMRYEDLKRELIERGYWK